MKDGKKLHHTIQIRVRYGETDRMGVVHHSAYVLYFEEARTAMLRDEGISYKELEDSGIILPIYEIHIQYKHPAYYDDILTIETTLEGISGVRIAFSYKVTDGSGTLLATAQTTLIFTDSQRFKPVRPPESVLQLVSDRIF
ncbi:MAG: acyl-CoA thioesterase [Chlorobi bacterium]|nr:acyl-CoA thioesterase [Chlorobiota bacterium]